MTITAQVLEAEPIYTGLTYVGKKWHKATLIVKTVDNFPRTVAINNFDDPFKFSNLTVGSIYKFEVNIESRKHSGKWYTDVVCWHWKPA